MANLTPRNMPWLHANMPRLYELMTDVVQSVSSIGSQVNAEPVGSAPSPPRIAGLNVVAGNGVFDARITDHAPVSRGVEYQLEYSTTPDFASSHLVHLGPSRNWRGSLGRQKLYFRAHSTYPTSAPSSPVLHGGAMASMVDGNHPVEPALQAGGGQRYGGADAERAGVWNAAVPVADRGGAGEAVRVRYAQERDRGRILELQPGWAAGAVVELVFVDENDRCVMAAGAWRLAEVHLAADAAWMTPRWRMEALRALHEQMRLELQTLGYVEAVTWLDVAETLRGFGRGLLRRLTREFGWVASERTSYHRRVR